MGSSWVRGGWGGDNQWGVSIIKELGTREWFKHRCPWGCQSCKESTETERNRIACCYNIGSLRPLTHTYTHTHCPIEVCYIQTIIYSNQNIRALKELAIVHAILRCSRSWLSQAWDTEFSLGRALLGFCFLSWWDFCDFALFFWIIIRLFLTCHKAAFTCSSWLLVSTSGLLSPALNTSGSTLQTHYHLNCPSISCSEFSFPSDHYLSVCHFGWLFSHGLLTPPMGYLLL